MYQKCFFPHLNQMMQYSFDATLVSTSNCIFLTRSNACIYIFIFMSWWVTSVLWTTVQILHFFSSWQLPCKPKFPSASALWVAWIEIPFVSPLFAPAGLPFHKEKHGSGASGSSDGLIIHGLSLWIIAHSPTAIIEIICSAHPAKCLCHLSQQ